jgi:Mn2+/Fe2+ NRAMP family transporter
MLFSYPLMAGIQEISAWIGRVTGIGIAGNIRRHYSVWVLYPVVAILLVANVINLGADISAMGSALNLLVGGSALFYSIVFGFLSVIAAVSVPYRQYAQLLKWSALVLVVYVATAFVVRVHWQSALAGTFIPTISPSRSYMTALTAVFGTTISPYLFFWQASLEVQEQRQRSARKPSSVLRSRRPHNSNRCGQTPTSAWHFPTQSHSLSFSIRLRSSMRMV